MAPNVEVGGFEAAGPNPPPMGAPIPAGVGLAALLSDVMFRGPSALLVGRALDRAELKALLELPTFNAP